MDSAFAHRNPDASAFEDGPLRGVRIAIQPNLSVAGWPTDAGSGALAGFTALEDATIVRRLRRAGATLCGATRMSEFGFGLRGSQAGVALQQQAADAELVLDLMGESRLAAWRAGVCGFKPSYGLVSRFGLVGLIPSMECCGLLSENLHAIRDILNTIAGPDELDFSLPEGETPDFPPRPMDPRATTLGTVTEAQRGLSPEQEGRFRASLDALARAGFSLRNLSMPDFDLFPVAHRIIGSVEASSCAGRYDSVRYGRRAPGARNWNDMYLLSRGAAFGPLLKGYLIQGAFFQFERYDAYEDACRIRARLLAEAARLTSEADFLVLPATDGAGVGAPASLAETYAQFAATAFANVVGQPVLGLPPPAGAVSSGIQLVGPRLSDARLLALGEQVLNLRK
ncbi:MAG: hypothetical protein JXQ71_05895 [Verrucomicrobia bacterium]|nr:hypothetical protein [Verrucomicrobiota bacterium]